MNTSHLIDKIGEKISQDWADNQSRAVSCSQIVEYIATRKFSEVCHLTKHSLSNIISPKPSNKDLIEITRYLSGGRVNVLTMKFELILNEESYILSAEEVRTLRNDGILVHPDTGELIEDPEDKVYVFFTPSEQIKAVQPTQ